jgi:hypothetical protein
MVWRGRVYFAGDRDGTMIAYDDKDLVLWIYNSDRNLQSVVPGPSGAYQPEPFFARPTRLYSAALAAGERFPFQPADELHPQRSEDGKKADGEKANLADWPVVLKKYLPLVGRVTDRAGLIVDVRHNRGGNIDSCILEKLLRTAWFHQGQIRDHPAPVPPPTYPDKASKHDRP